MTEQHHEELIDGITKQFKPVLDKSEQAIYIYLDDNHKVCNNKFAELLGYRSAKEWAKTDAPLADVVENDQQNVITAYKNASERMIASEIKVRVQNIKTGRVVKTKMTLAPIAFSNHIFTIQFFSQIYFDNI